MESMITVLYLEKSRKVKKFKTKETMGSYCPSGPISIPLIVGFTWLANITFQTFGMLSTIILPQIQKFQEDIPT